MGVIDALQEMQSRKVDEVLKRLERLLGSLEDEQVVLRLGVLRNDDFDLLLECKTCRYVVRVATLPWNDPSCWQDLIATQSITALKNFSFHRCAVEASVPRK